MYVKTYTIDCYFYYFINRFFCKLKIDFLGISVGKDYYIFLLEYIRR